MGLDTMVTDAEVAIARSTLTSALVSLFVESLLFGAFTVLYGLCASVLLFRDTCGGRVRWRRDYVLFTASTLMFLLTLTHVALDVHIALDSFVVRGGDMREMSITLNFFNGLSTSIGAAKFGIYVTQVLIGDGFMIYRAYIVWDRRRLITVLPLLLLAAEVVLGYYISFSGPAMITDGMPGTSCVDALVNVFFLLSVATNLISTGFIMIPILRADCDLQEYSPHQVRTVKWRVVESILQSAAIYSVTSISLAVTSFVSPTIAFPACHSVFPSVIGIVFLLIVARICWNTASAELPRHSTIQVNSASCPNIPVAMHAHAHPHSHVHEAAEPQSPMASSLRSMPIAIHVSVSTTSDRESVSSYERGSPSMISKVLDELSMGAVMVESPMSPKGPALFDEEHVR